MYYLAAGEPPFNGKDIFAPLKEYPNDLPEQFEDPWFKDLIIECMKCENDRPTMERLMIGEQNHAILEDALDDEHMENLRQ